MKDTTPTAPAENKKTEYLHKMIAFLLSDEMTYYNRSEQIFVDTKPLKGKKLLNVESGEFRAFLMRLARTMDGLLLQKAQVDIIIEHVFYHAIDVAKPLSADPRACLRDGVLWINPAWKNQKLIRIANGTWEIVDPPAYIFAPLPPSMAMPVPVPSPAENFPKLIAKGITSFGDFHCFYCTAIATMMMPADDVYPILILSGEGAKGKSTTMKLTTQLVDPDEGNECMIVGDDQRDILVACLTRKTIGLDNASKLPIGDDLLSQMFAGGVSKERKLHTNNEQATIKIGRMRIFINGVSPDFSKSDFFTKAIFIEQPVVTRNGRFDSLSAVEREWKTMLPETLGALLSVIAGGLPYYDAWAARRAKEGRRPDAAVRFVEFAVMGESFSRAMGYGPDMFTHQVEALSETSKQTAANSDECTQLLLTWAEGKRGSTNTEDAWAGSTYPKADSYKITTGDLHMELQALAKTEGYNIYKMPWINNPVAFGKHFRKTLQTLNNTEWFVLLQAKHGSGWIIERKKDGASEYQQPILIQKSFAASASM